MLKNSSLAYNRKSTLFPCSSASSTGDVTFAVKLTSHSIENRGWLGTRMKSLAGRELRTRRVVCVQPFIEKSGRLCTGYTGLIVFRFNWVSDQVCSIFLSSSCSYKSLGRFCGSHPPSDIISPDHCMRLEFHSSGKANSRRGFRARLIVTAEIKTLLPVQAFRSEKARATYMYITTLYFK